jgi:uncharacterized MAPEG superfamily protein
MSAHAGPRLASAHGPKRRPASYPLLDAGAWATLLILIGVFLLPTLAWIARAPVSDHPPARPVELVMLAGSVLLCLLLPIVQIGMQIRRHGGGAVRGNRDFQPRAIGAVARLSRAHANLVESLVAFAAVVLAANAMGISNRWTVAAATLYLAARIVHALAYAAGVTILRSSAFYAGWLATVTIAAVVL